MRQWAEGVRSLCHHHETVAVHFHLWASVSHLSASKESGLLSVKRSERSSVDSVRARQGYTCRSSTFKKKKSSKPVCVERSDSHLSLVWGFAINHHETKTV